MKIMIHEFRYRKYPCSTINFDLVMYDKDEFFEPLEGYSYSKEKAYALFKTLSQLEYEVEFPEEYNFQQVTVRYPFTYVKELFETHYAYALVLSNDISAKKLSANSLPWHRLLFDKEKLIEVVKKLDKDLELEKEKVIEFIKHNVPINSKLIDKFMVYTYRLDAWDQISICMLRNEPILDNYLLKKAYEFTVKEHQE